MKITETFEAELRVKRSRFIAKLIAPPIDGDLKAIVIQIKKEHRKARHHCLASRVYDEKGSLVEQAKNDGEVGQPGQKLLELLRANDLEGAIIVTRYFGGIKLGPAGVGRAFRDAALLAIEKLLEKSSY